MASRPESLLILWMQDTVLCMVLSELFWQAYWIFPNCQNAKINTCKNLAQLSENIFLAPCFTVWITQHCRQPQGVSAPSGERALLLPFGDEVFSCPDNRLPWIGRCTVPNSIIHTLLSEHHWDVCNDGCSCLNCWSTYTEFSTSPRATPLRLTHCA